MKKMIKKIRIIISLLLVCVTAANLNGCTAAPTVYAANLMDGIKAGEIHGRTADDKFTASYMELAVKLFKSSVNESRDGNVLISPLSIQIALAMTANGADGKTLSEMEKLIGGDLSVTELNEYLYTYADSLPSDENMKFKIANSIWFRDDEGRLQVEQEFLQTNADYYSADAYKSAFDDKTLKDINNWVNDHTDGMIDSILDEIKSDTVMYLINALVFDAKWEKTYEKTDIRNGIFNSVTGGKQNVKMMFSDESKYLDDGKATGFIKPYKDNKYSFAALLPNEGEDIYDYIAGLTSAGLQETLKGVYEGSVAVTIPKFSYDYGLKMNDVLKTLGMSDAFDGNNADFSKMAHSGMGNIYIGEVLHKTFISVDENGTKAGAVTKVDACDEGACIPLLEVRLDRPFVYMIIDNSTNLPIFIGTVTEISMQNN